MRYPAYFFDLDGTCYRGSEPVPHAANAIQQLYASGAQIRYGTNNSAADPTKTCEKLKGMGFPCEPEWVYGSGPTTARYLVREGIESVFVVGEPQLHETLRGFGLAESDSPEAVVVGICRTFSYELLAEAQAHILNGAKFIATNQDPTFPMEGGALKPGAGSIVAAILTATSVEPTVIGKPNPQMILDALFDLGLERREMLVVGDREDTDIAAGLAAGCPTWMVLTGVTFELPGGQDGGDDLRSII
ncbi:MAG: HAD-IIA family hydrolase [Armatimonadetes bacterium]|nr:HAD-IIA family hydrolase [Armatimonadota bacterium]